MKKRSKDIFPDLLYYQALYSNNYLFPTAMPTMFFPFPSLKEYKEENAHRDERD